MNAPFSTERLSEVIGRYLRHCYEDQDFAAFHGLHSPDASLLLGGRIIKAGEATPAAFQRATQALLPAGAQRRGVRFGAAELIGRVPGPRLPGDEVVALARVREPDSGTAWVAAFAVVAPAAADGLPCVRWATLTTLAPPLLERLAATLAQAELAPCDGVDVELLQAQAHGELAYAPVGGAAVLLSALELSHYRQVPALHVPLHFLPEAHFSCHMTGRCCANNWLIHLSEADRLALEARDYRRRLPMLDPGRPLYTRIPAGAPVGGDPRPYALTRRDPRTDLEQTLSKPPTTAGVPTGGPIDYRCTFLTEDKRCVPHGEAGMAVYADCHVYPFGFTLTPDGVAAWSLLSCPSARACKGKSFSDNQADIRGRLQRIPQGAPPTTFLRRPGAAIAWPAFRASEEVLLRYLGADAPVRQRLLAALRWLERWEQAPAAPPAYDEALLGTKLIPPSAAEHGFADGVYKMMTQSSALCALPPLATATGAFLDDALTGSPVAPYLLRTLVFSKSLSFRYGVVPGFNFTVLAYALLVRRLNGRHLEDVSEDDLGVFFSSLQQAHYFKLLEMVYEHAVLRELSTSPLFGELLLRTAVMPRARPVTARSAPQAAAP